jgi:cardiolipin synthase
MISDYFPQLSTFVTSVVLATHALGVITSVHAILKTRTSQGAIAWALALITLPYLALPLYLVFGRDRFRGYIGARREEGQRIQHLRESMARRAQDRCSLPKSAPESYLVFNELAQMPFTTGNQACLLIDGKATFDAIFAGIDAATRYVLVQFFIVHDDQIGRELKARLLAKARQGVAIYFLYDEIGSHALPRRYTRELRRGGIHTAPFKTSRGLSFRFQINFRNHRKIVVVDGQLAFVGGMNVGDEYLGRSRRFGPWRDTFASVSGPATKAIQLSFLDDWHWSTGEVPDLDWSIDRDESDGKGTPVLVLPTGPADDLDSCTLFFAQAIQLAKERVWISSPYFVPLPEILVALQLAVLRGVDVRILLPGMPDHLLVYLAAFSYLKDTLPVGVKMYRYKEGFLHEKVMVVDDQLAAVGTANLDTRSLRLQFEITLLFADRSFAAEVKKMLEADFARSRPLLISEINDRSFAFKVIVRIARLLAPVL